MRSTYNTQNVMIRCAGVMDMANVADVMGIVDSIAPSFLRFEKDKIGLQVVSRGNPVVRVVVSVEVTEEVVNEERDKGVNLVLSHNPLIYQSLDRVLADDYIGDLVSTLIK